MESEPSSPIHYSLNNSNEVASSSPAIESSMLGNTTSGRTSKKRSACWEDFEELEPGEQLIEQQKHGDNKKREYFLKFLKFILPQLGSRYANKWMDILNEMRILFEEYKSRHTQLQNSNAFENIDDGSRELDDEMIGFFQYDNQSSNSQSELDLYLNENRVNYRMKLDVLDFWKRSQFKYPILTTMAKDLLCIPVTTVASESSFSMGGRVINKWRSRILSENAEMLITTRNWFCSFDDEDEKNEILIGRALSEMDSTPSSPV